MSAVVPPPVLGSASTNARPAEKIPKQSTKAPVASIAPNLSLQFAALQNDSLLRAALNRGSATVPDRIPVWIMRQAGRYLPEYHKIRAKGDFFTICRTPSLACQMTLLPLKRFDLDAAIIFSDILVVPQALGMKVNMVKGVGPVFPHPLQDPTHLSRLIPAAKLNVKQSLGYVYDALRVTRHALRGSVPLIGFCGGPWTLMAYMVQGRGAKTFNKAKAWLYAHPKHAHQLLKRITDVCVQFLVGQARAGAQYLQVFESWAGDLTPEAFNTFVLPCLKTIAQNVKKALSSSSDLKQSDTTSSEVPLCIFAKGAYYALEDLSAIGFDVVNVDWTVRPKEARQRVNKRITLQGNLDPSILFASKSTIESQVHQMIRDFGPTSYIANLGHGLSPNHKPKAVKWFVDAVHAYSCS